MTNLSSMITSPPDRENLVFEIWAGTNQLAEVSREPGRSVEIEIYPPVEGGSWNFELEEFMSLLNQAAKNLNYG
ncbi:hypothetical protein [Pseudomonas thivervalensis]|uniref:hypothetical protein n=1 Tax=Pseudomonas thivervalensis TaxID=86265 RepID=UPI0009EBAAC4|nr:hypothetical protein [Pseudomonas thivervalensis]